MSIRRNCDNIINKEAEDPEDTLSSSMTSRSAGAFFFDVRHIDHIRATGGI